MKFLLVATLLLLGCLLMAAFLLGASALDQDLPFGLNAGVAAAALALVLAAVGPAWLAGPGTRLRAVARIALGAAVAWLVLTGFVLLSVLGSWGGLLLAQARRRPAA